MASTTPGHSEDLPQRLQLSRREGFRLPPGSASVAHPTPWANPYRRAVRTPEGNAAAVGHFIDYLRRNPTLVTRARHELTGLNLACWCRLTLPCHGDVWLLLTGQLSALPPAAALAAIRVSAAAGVHAQQ